MNSSSTILLLFDGECNLCNRAVQFIIKRDKRNRIKFASVQSETGIGYIKDKKLPESYSSSIVLIEGEKVYFKSAAALRICLKLTAFWPLLYIFILIPAFLRNLVYEFIAQRRFYWLGRTAHCWVMKKEWKHKFL